MIKDYYEKITNNFNLSVSVVICCQKIFFSLKNFVFSRIINFPDISEKNFSRIDDLTCISRNLISRIRGKI